MVCAGQLVPLPGCEGSDVGQLVRPLFGDSTLKQGLFWLS